VAKLKNALNVGSHGRLAADLNEVMS
jgi:hypothetical protein